jgi:hypothetical protein
MLRGRARDFDVFALETMFELSHAFLLMSLNFVVVLPLKGWLLSGPVTLQGMPGMGLIVLGTEIAARG